MQWWASAGARSIRSLPILVNHAGRVVHTWTCGSAPVWALPPSRLAAADLFEVLPHRADLDAILHLGHRRDSGGCPFLCGRARRLVRASCTALIVLGSTG